MVVPGYGFYMKVTASRAICPRRGIFPCSWLVKYLPAIVLVIHKKAAVFFGVFFIVPLVFFDATVAAAAAQTATETAAQTAVQTAVQTATETATQAQTSAAAAAAAATATATAQGELLPETVSKVFVDTEQLYYNISWTGGIKIGELKLEVRKARDDYEIQANVSSYGLFRLAYPVDDVFLTRLASFTKLPALYKVLQREGHGRRETRRETVYDQAGLEIYYRRDSEEMQTFAVEGPVHNEFSSFFFTRCARFNGLDSFIVPTFADKKRHEVDVRVLGREEIDSIYGPVPTVRVQPKMTFRGMYNKDGDTIIWFIDDECRVPVKINSKILIGSLTATLVGYDNAACAQYAASRPR